MLGRAIWDKLCECIFENFKIVLAKLARMIYPKNRPKQTCDYWLITLNQQNLFIETNIF